MPDAVSVLTPVLTPVLAGIVAVASIALLLPRVRAAATLIDQPNHRSLHATPIPRIGGIGIWIGVAAAWSLSGTSIPWLLVIAMLLTVVVSAADDWRAQPVALRLPVQFGAAAIVGLWLYPGGWMTVAIVMLLLAWSANLFNFMDGADGLAGGMALIGFATLGWAALQAGHASSALALAVSAAALGFLAFNAPPARVFMGDAGSVPLGLLAGAIAIWGVRDDVWPWWFPIMTFLPFILDATWTLAWRILRRQRFWVAHREHLYQQLILIGWSHRKLLFAACPVMLCCGLLGLVLLRLPLAWHVPGFVAFCLCVVTGYAWLRARVAAHQA